MKCIRNLVVNRRVRLKERKLGETFNYFGTRIMVVPFNNCDDCVFRNAKCSRYMHCDVTRSDHGNIMYVSVEDL